MYNLKKNLFYVCTFLLPGLCHFWKTVASDQVVHLFSIQFPCLQQLVKSHPPDLFDQQPLILIVFTGSGINYL